VTFDSPVLRRFKLSDLRVLHAVAEHGGMAKAASHLNLSQPAVSKAIGAMERTLGVRLLDRNAQGVEPTIYGRALMESGVAVFDELNQSLKRIAFLLDSAAGELRIGCTEFGAPGFAATVIDAFSRSYPRVSCHVVTADLRTLIERDLRQRNIELATAGGAVQLSDPDITVENLFHDHQAIMAGTRNKWARRRNIALGELIGEPWILPPSGSPDFAAVAEAFRRRGLKPPYASIETHSISLCHRLLATGRYLAMQPVVMTRLAEHLPIKLLDVDFVGFSSPVGVMTVKGRTLSPIAQLFIDRARELAKSLPQGTPSG
jgi:DNA-binding transcriptional LysR family regulator